MASSNEYPRVLYRDGAQEDVWGKKCDLLTVNDADELQTALADGWTKRPDGLDDEPAEDADPKPMPARAKKAPELKPADPPTADPPAAE